MTLPRFTSGSIGTLTFAHLNEAFDLLESLTGSPELVQAAKNRVASRLIVAKVLAKSGTGAAEVGSFEEVSLTTPTSGTYATVEGGVKSTDGTNAFAAPIVSPVSAVDTIVTLLAHRAANGALCFREIGTVKDPSVVMLKILSAAGGPSAWTYTARVVEWNNGFVETTGQDVTARNGAESAVDNTASRNIGVGTVHVAGSTATRNPIKTGTIVGAAIKYGNTYTFSIPNGYSFACL
jgi:hypothetical protein